MKRFPLWIITPGFLWSLGVSPVSAQLTSIPVYFSPKGGTGFTIAGEFGRGANDESGKNTAVAVRAALGISAFSIGGAIGLVNPAPLPGLDRDTEVQYAGTAALRIVGGSLLPVAVSLQVGVGVLKREVLSGLSFVEQKEVNIPIGVGVALNIPTPGFSFEPWVAPRIEIARTRHSGQKQTRTGVGMSGGINLGSIIGLGVHVAFDWVSFADATAGPLTLAGIKPTTLGFGLHYTLRLPGLGVPLVPGV